MIKVRGVPRGYLYHSRTNRLIIKISYQMTQVLSDDERRAFEAYLLAGENQALKEKSLGNLVEGSVPYYYLYFIDKLKMGGVGSLSEKDNEMFVKFTEAKQSKNTPQARQIKLWHTLLKLDLEADP